MKRIVLASLLFAISLPAFADTKCHMKFTLSGWSVFYKTASGNGTISCDNGESAPAKISSKGGGITFGRSTIDGIGTFTDVSSISELFGTYVQSDAHAGAGKSTKASAMTKGEVSLSIVGKGKGVDVGIAVGKFTIERVGK